MQAATSNHAMILLSAQVLTVINNYTLPRSKIKKIICLLGTWFKITTWELVTITEDLIGRQYYLLHSLTLGDML